MITIEKDLMEVMQRTWNDHHILVNCIEIEWLEITEIGGKKEFKPLSIRVETEAWRD